MIVIKQHSILLFVFFLSIIISVHAYSSGAGHCRTGKAISNFSHGRSGTTLQDGNYNLYFNGNIIDPTSTINLPTGIKHIITLKHDDGGSFRGFLFRLSGKGDEVVNSNMKQIMNVNTGFEEIAQNSWRCEHDANIAGITHQTSRTKSSVEITLNHNLPMNLQLEMTVVFQKTTWHYTSYDITLQESVTTEEPTEGPTRISSSPSLTPSYVGETVVPSSHPSIVPTAMGSVEPSPYPSISFSPTNDSSDKDLNEQQQANQATATSAGKRTRYMNWLVSYGLSTFIMIVHQNIY